MDDWLGDSELLACALAEHPAFRSGAELDRIDPHALSAGEQVDLLAVLEEQRALVRSRPAAGAGRHPIA
jgi:hypothetical protein